MSALKLCFLVPKKLISMAKSANQPLIYLWFAFVFPYLYTVPALNLKGLDFFLKRKSSPNPCFHSETVNYDDFKEWGKEKKKAIRSLCQSAFPFDHNEGRILLSPVDTKSISRDRHCMLWVDEIKFTIARFEKWYKDMTMVKGINSTFDWSDKTSIKRNLPRIKRDWLELTLSIFGGISFILVSTLIP